MNWIINNWSLLIVILAVIVIGIYYLKKFSGMPSEAQQKKIKEWLLYAVIMAEKEFQSGTGMLKLRYVYDLFLERFPSIAPVVPFETFSMWVDMALEQMKHLMETNNSISVYVKGNVE